MVGFRNRIPMGEEFVILLSDNCHYLVGRTGLLHFVAKAEAFSQSWWRSIREGSGCRLHSRTLPDGRVLVLK